MSEQTSVNGQVSRQGAGQADGPVNQFAGPVNQFACTAARGVGRLWRVLLGQAWPPAPRGVTWVMAGAESEPSHAEATGDAGDLAT